MSRDFEALIEEALTALEHGGSVDALLERYPEEADALAPLLTTAARCQEILAFAESPSPQALAAGRQRFLTEAARQRTAPRARPRLALPAWLRPSLQPAFALAMAAVVLVVLVGGGATMAAADSLPGDLLYPVKLASEQTRLALTFDPTARTQLASRFADARRQEARAVAALGRQVPVRFQGVLEAFDAGSWTVGGLTVALGEETRVEGTPTLGATVLVMAWSPGDGTLRARHLRVVPSVLPSRATGTPSPTHEPAHTPRPTSTPGPEATHTPPRPTVSPTELEHEPTRGPITPTGERGGPMMPGPTGTMSGPGMTPTHEREHETPRPTDTHGMRPTEPAHTPQGPEPTHGPQMTPEPGETHGPHMTPGPQPTSEPAATDAPTSAPAPTEAPTQPPHEPMMTPGPHHTPRH